MQSNMAILAASSAVVVVVASLADRRRNRRANLDRVGFMPWSLISIVAMMVTLIAIPLALQGY